jgi:kexin
MANNNQCGVGTAPNSKVSGIRLIAESTTDADEAEGLSYRLDVNHILSSSWGPYDDGMRLEG